jgi:hypothetical protein
MYSMVSVSKRLHGPPNDVSCCITSTQLPRQERKGTIGAKLGERESAETRFEERRGNGLYKRLVRRYIEYTRVRDDSHTTTSGGRDGLEGGGRRDRWER